MKNEKKQTTQTILLAALATVALYFVPYASFLTYPVRLFVTFIHEGGHALAALLTGGWVLGLGVSPDGSGLTLTAGGVQPIVNAAGYLGATLFGTLLLAALRRGVSAKKLLLLCTAAIVLMLPATVAGLISNTTGAFFGLVTGVPIALFLLFATARFSKSVQAWLVGFLGVQCVLNALFDLKTLFLLSATSTVHTDAMNMQQATLIPAIVWSVLWMVTALVILWGFLIRPALRER